MTDDAQPVAVMNSTAAVVARQHIGEATSLIDYQSAGHCLIVGDVNEALALAPQLTGLRVTVAHVVPDQATLNKRLTESGIAVFATSKLTLTGHLGAFLVLAADGNKETNLAVSVYLESGAFDLVLDLSSTPLINASVPPFGYVPAYEDQARAAAVAALPDLVGEFEKPKYFDYRADICAHSRSELIGCSNCLDVCVTGAIRSSGEGIEVDPYLCQGCGSCATLCPSGAMSYAYPKPADAIARTRQMLAESSQHVLLLHTENEQGSIDKAALPDSVLPLHVEEVSAFGLLVEEVSAFGMDYWASMVCSGVHRIVLLNSADDSDPNRQAVLRQSHLFHQLLAGLGVNAAVIIVLAADELSTIGGYCDPDPTLATLSPANFATHNDKRQTLRLAFDSLVEQLPPSSPSQALQADAPFGRIAVDQAACTLCMACVSVCPGKALLDGQDTPALRMIEANCLQCGLCESACPESAITLEPRYTYDSLAARRIDVLNEEAPFHCVVCHKAFATSRMIDTMLSKLAGHWMFTDEKSTRRLKMCEDCRVKDMFNDGGDGIDVHKEPPNA